LLRDIEVAAYTWKDAVTLTLFALTESRFKTPPPYPSHEWAEAV